MAVSLHCVTRSSIRAGTNRNEAKSEKIEIRKPDRDLEAQFCYWLYSSRWVACLLQAGLRKGRIIPQADRFTPNADKACHALVWCRACTVKGGTSSAPQRQGRL